MKMVYACLKIFGAHGGIENFNRNLVHAIADAQPTDEALSFRGFSLHDRQEQIDPRYLKDLKFEACGGNKRAFALGLLRAATRADVLVLAHVNLAPVALLAKALHPRLRLVTLAYGVDVWGKVRPDKRALLRLSDQILAISRYTRDRLSDNQGVPVSRVELLPVTIDPYLNLEKEQPRAAARQRLSLAPSAPLILTVCRLNQRERYKGYDRVIESMPQILNEFPSAQYLICGKADAEEERRLQQLIRTHRLESSVRLVGFVTDEQLADYYRACDVFVMPSTGEGFGIVFLEALRMGRPVIAGNRDGSVDAVLNGELGLLVDPLSFAEIARAIRDVLGARVDIKLVDSARLKQAVYNEFGFPAFKQRVERFLLHPR